MIIRKIKILLLFLTLIPFFYGCPGIIIQQLERDIAIEDSLRRFKPKFISSSVSIKKLSDTKKFYDSTSQIKNINVIHHPDSNKITKGAEANIISDTTKNLKFNIFSDVNKVISDKYPDEIELQLLVYDSYQRYITGLAPPYYKESGNYLDYWVSVFDSCSNTNTKINNFEVTEIREVDSPPYSIAFVLDHSPSMGDNRARKLQEAIRIILKAVKKGDSVAVIKFSSKIFIESKLSSDKNVYLKQFKIDGTKGYGTGTAMYDGIQAGIDELDKSGNNYKKVLILFSDGGDNSSKIKIDSIQRVAKSKNITIYSIGLGFVNYEILADLSDYTGGKFYQIYSANEFLYVFKNIYLTLNNYYKLKYIPPKCDDKHKVTVNISLPVDSNNYQAVGIGYYDKSIFTEHDPIGTTTFINIEFDFGKADIRKESLPLIESVAKSMKGNENLKLKIVGHTDNIGNDEDNLVLSTNRALSVLNELVRLGIDKDRLSYEGCGERKPIIDNDTEENRQKNRRIEFIILDK